MKLIFIVCSLRIFWVGEGLIFLFLLCFLLFLLLLLPNSHSHTHTYTQTHTFCCQYSCHISMAFNLYISTIVQNDKINNERIYSVLQSPLVRNNLSFHFYLSSENRTLNILNYFLLFLYNLIETGFN